MTMDHQCTGTKYPLIMVETQHFNKMKIERDPRVPKNFEAAMKIPEWRAAIDRELTKLETNMCLQLVPFNNQHLVPMMWTFVIVMWTHDVALAKQD